MKKNTMLKFLTLFSLGFLQTSLLFADFSSKKYEEIKESLAGPKHPNVTELKSIVDKIEKTEPELYLLKLIDETGLLNAVKFRAINLLQFYPTNSVKIKLKNVIQNKEYDSSTREIATKALILGFQTKERSDLEAFLKPYRSDATIGKMIRTYWK